MVPHSWVFPEAFEKSLCFFSFPLNSQKTTNSEGNSGEKSHSSLWEPSFDQIVQRELMWAPDIEMGIYKDKIFKFWQWNRVQRNIITQQGRSMRCNQLSCKWPLFPPPPPCLSSPDPPPAPFLLVLHSKSNRSRASSCMTVQTKWLLWACITDSVFSFHPFDFVWYIGAMMFRTAVEHAKKHPGVSKLSFLCSFMNCNILVGTL